MKNILLLLPILAAITSCGDIQQTQAVNLTPVSKTITSVNGYSKNARAELAVAKKISAEAETEAVGFRKVVDEMEVAKSPYRFVVAELQLSYEQKIRSLQAHIEHTDQILAQQQASLMLAESELEEAKQLSIANEAEKVELRKDRDKFKTKYEGLKKYRYIIVGLAVWLLIKLFGSLGAWSPQGRIAKILMG